MIAIYIGNNILNRTCGKYLTAKDKNVFTL